MGCVGAALRMGSESRGFNTVRIFPSASLWIFTQQTCQSSQAFQDKQLGPFFSPQRLEPCKFPPRQLDCGVAVRGCVWVTLHRSPELTRSQHLPPLNFYVELRNEAFDFLIVGFCDIAQASSGPLAHSALPSQPPTWFILVRGFSQTCLALLLWACHEVAHGRERESGLIT